MALAAFLTSLPPLAAEWALGHAIWPATATAWAIVAFVALGPSLLAQLSFIRGVELIGPNRAGLFVNLVPVFGAGLAVLLAGATSLLPVYARDILHVGSQGLGLLAAGMGIGPATTAIWFSFRPMKSNVGVKMLIAVVVFGLAILTFGVATPIVNLLGLTPGTIAGIPVQPAFVLSLVALIVAGGADMISVYVRQSLIQLHTPDAMRGRVSAVSQLTISASNELGEFESGVMASLLGPVGAVVFGGVGAIAITIGWARLFPELGRAKTFDPPEILETEPQHGEAKP